MPRGVYDRSKTKQAPAKKTSAPKTTKKVAAKVKKTAVAKKAAK